tara:strand:- start:584 stop:763 length:180 start_codon:yes stop_codon:yes gene_type:complete
MSRNKNTNQGQKLTANTNSVAVELRTEEVLVEMINDDGKKADVHPLEVDNYTRGGFKKV